jgi:hypothetical protein
MSEQIVKILPTNRFSEEAVPAAFIGSNLLDFNIPGGLGTYDLSNSYININASIIQEIDPANSAIQGLVVGQDTALFSTELELQTGLTANDTYVVGCASLVRNAQMFSQNRGMVESIRRCDTLRQILYNLENDKKEIENGLNKFGTFNGRRGISNKTSSFQNTVVNNTDMNGGVDLNNKSYSIPRDLRIPLSDLFGVGNALWNGSVYGDTRINLELNTNNLVLKQLGGLEDVTKVPNSDAVLPPGGQGVSYGSCLNQAATTVVSTPFNTLILGRPSTPAVVTPYCDFGLNMPFHVGQSIVVNGFDNLLSSAGVIGTADVTGVGTDYTVGEYFKLPASTNAGAVREAWVVVKTITGGAATGPIGTIESTFSNPFDLAANAAGPGGGYVSSSILNQDGGSFLATGAAGAGTGGAIQVTGVKESGNIATLKAAIVGGSGYAVGDEGHFDASGTGTGAKYKVKTMNNGAITELLILDPGQNYTVDDVLTGVATSGAGDDLQVTVATIMILAPVVYPAAQPATNAIPEIRVIIDSIEYAPSDPLQVNSQPGGAVTITTRTPWYTGNAARLGQLIQDVTIKADVASSTLSKIRLNRAEIVLSVLAGVNGPNEIDYRTYTTDEQNGNGQPSYFHQYQVEGEAQNLIVGLCANNTITPIQTFNSYRMAIENVDQTGNRSVEFNSSLYQDRVLRFLRNRGQTPSNLTIQTKSTVAQQQGSANQQLLSPILESLPISALPKAVTLHIESASNEQVILYKEIARTI